MAPKKHRRKTRRGSSKAGRPAKPGARYDCGKLKFAPPEPNPVVLAQRRAALGDAAASLATAECPLDLAHARGWLTERQHRAGAAFARIRTAAGLGAPGLSSGGPDEAPEPRGRDLRPVREMSGKEIVDAWDQVMNLPASTASHDRSANALRTWQLVCSKITYIELAEVELVCVRSSWPFWITARCAGDFGTAWERKRDLLVSGLDKVAEVVFTAADRLDPALEREIGDMLGGGKVLNRKPGPVREEVTVYVAAGAAEDEAPLLTVVRRGRGA